MCCLIKHPLNSHMNAANLRRDRQNEPRAKVQHSDGCLVALQSTADEWQQIAFRAVTVVPAADTQDPAKSNMAEMLVSHKYERTVAPCRLLLS